MQPQIVPFHYAGDYVIHALLGQGGQANVYLASKHNNLYAVKIYFPDKNCDLSYEREVKYLSQLNYPYLVSMVDHHPDAKVKLEKMAAEQRRRMLVMEYSSGSDLQQHIQYGKNFSPEICRALFKRLINAMIYLKSQGIVHRDIKLDNIIFDKDYNLKVTDFGLSTHTQDQNREAIFQEIVGADGYKAPQMYSGRYEGFQTDIFAAGVVLFNIYSSTRPFQSARKYDKIYKIIRQKRFGDFWKLHQKNKAAGIYPQSFKKLINSIFNADPSQRPTLESLAEDQWLNGVQAPQQQVQRQLKSRYGLISAKSNIYIRIENVKKNLLQEKKFLKNSKDTIKQQILQNPQAISKNITQISFNVE